MTVTKMEFSDHSWIKEAVVYQVYPASFASTGSGNVPGWGDIKGITSKLDHIKDLGVDVLWVSPIYKSPQVDMGYDISDYEEIDPKYGTIADVDDLIKGLKARGMKLMMDLVANHTSDQHKWFQESRKSKDNPKRDWYIWQPAKHDKDGKRVPPNNWAMCLGEAHSAWTWDETTQEYYLSLYTPEQPDLNWRNPDVRKAIHDVLRFWLDRGASGFRMDVINHISKVEGFPDAKIRVPGEKYQPGWDGYINGPHLHEYLQEMNSEVLSKYGAMTVGEMPCVKDDNEILRIVGANNGELNMIFIFEIVNIDDEPGSYRMTYHDWEPKELRRIISHWQTLMQEGNGWNSVFLENHDNPRSVSRYTDDSDEHRELGSKLLCLMQTTLSGTQYVYQGQEIGQRNIPENWQASEYKDIETLNYFQKMQDLGKPEAEALKMAQRKARDSARVPVQWTDGANAGFCASDVQPWMRVNDDYKTVNVAAQQAFDQPDQLSILQFWKQALENRKKNKDVFVYGTYTLLDNEHTSVISYKRASKTEAFVVALNFAGKTVEWTVPSNAKVQKWVAGTYQKSAPEKAVDGKISLKPWEGILGKILTNDHCNTYGTPTDKQ